MKKFYYLLSLVSVFVIPTIVAGYFLQDIVTPQKLIPFIIFITVIGSIWDIWATKHGKKDSVWLWQFNHQQTLGIKIFDLPIEEYLFYVTSSIYIVYMWEGIKQMTQAGNSQLSIVIPLLTLWTLLAILLPYKLGSRGDKLIE